MLLISNLLPRSRLKFSLVTHEIYFIMLHSYQVVQYVHAQHRLDFDIYLFINTKSGGHVGMKFMTLEVGYADILDGNHGICDARSQNQRQLLRSKRQEPAAGRPQKTQSS